MVLKLPPQRPLLPSFLRRLTNEEFTPVPHTARQRQAVARIRADGPKAASRLSMPLADYWSGRRGTAAALSAIDEAYGGGFYNVPPESELDREAADSALGGDQLVIDVQTHFIADRAPMREWCDMLIGLADFVAADRFRGLDKLMRTQTQAGYSLAEHLRNIYLESDTNIAVLSSAPGAESETTISRGYRAAEMRMVNNAEMVGTRELIERLGGTGRLLNHSVVHPNIAGELDKMDRWQDWCRPVGWKVYTLHGSEGVEPFKSEARPWALDDEQSGLPFLHRAMATGVRIISAHKGVSGGADTSWNGPSSPKDVGPAAKAFPGINFLIYHSGYEPREGGQEEGPYTETTAHVGVNRLITSLKEAGIGPGGNVFAELGATWYMIMSHPQEAAHVMGKLLKYMGEDNILWGTDCVFFGSPQPLIEAFRAFQIPDGYRDKYGYPQLTSAAKEKILGLNAARLYGIDPSQARTAFLNDDLSWVKAAIEEYKAKGTPSTV